MYSTYKPCNDAFILANNSERLTNPFSCIYPSPMVSNSAIFISFTLALLHRDPSNPIADHLESIAMTQLMNNDKVQSATSKLSVCLWNKITVDSITTHMLESVEKSHSRGRFSCYMNNIKQVVSGACRWEMDEWTCIDTGLYQTIGPYHTYYGSQWVPLTSYVADK